MRQRMLSIGDDYEIENERGERVFKLDGKALRIRKTILFKDMDGRELLKIQERMLHIKDSGPNTTRRTHRVSLTGATALLVIDVQNGVVASAHNRDRVIANIGALAGKARAEDVPVIWVQHSDEDLPQGSESWQYVPELRWCRFFRFRCAAIFSAWRPAGRYDLVYDSGCLHHPPPHRRVSSRNPLDRVLAPCGHFGFARRYSATSRRRVASARQTSTSRSRSVSAESNWVPSSRLDRSGPRTSSGST